MGWPRTTLMNINFPGVPAGEVKGVAVTPQGSYDLQSTEIEERKDARFRSYFWIGLRRRRSQAKDDSDLGAVAAGKISVTPLHMNLTERETLAKMRETLGQS
jgi:5'-nucleotidase